MSSVSFENGQVLTSSALTPQGIMTLFQGLTALMLGYQPSGPTDPAYYAVRIDWQQQGQPAWGINEDIAFVKAVESPKTWGRIQDRSYTPNNGVSAQLNISYTRKWDVSWTAYGPNSSDRIRIIRDCLYLDWTHNSLAGSNLYLVSDVPKPVNAPERYQGQWWLRTDLSAEFNELVQETILDPLVASAQVVVVDKRGVEAVINIAP